MPISVSKFAAIIYFLVLIRRNLRERNDLPFSNLKTIFSVEIFVQEVISFNIDGILKIASNFLTEYCCFSRFLRILQNIFY